MKKIVFALIALVVSMTGRAQTDLIDTAFVADGYHRVKTWCTAALLQQEGAKMVQDSGLQKTRVTIYALSTIEGPGPNMRENAIGPIHITPIMHKDYFQHNPNALYFEHADLGQPGKEYLSLRIFFWFAEFKGYGHGGVLENIVRLWNGGPDGTTPAETHSDPAKQAAQRIELEKTKAHAEKFDFAYKVSWQFEETGVSIIM